MLHIMDTSAPGFDPGPLGHSDSSSNCFNIPFPRIKTHDFLSRPTIKLLWAHAYNVDNHNVDSHNVEIKMLKVIMSTPS